MGEVLRYTCRVFASVLAAFTLYQYAWLPQRSNHILKDVELRTHAALQASADRAIIVARDNIVRLGPLEKSSQLSVDYHLLYAANALLLNRREAALQHYTAALAANHRPEIYFDRGMAYLEQGNLDAAVADLAIASRFDPKYLDLLDTTTRTRVEAAMARK